MTIPKFKSKQKTLAIAETTSTAILAFAVLATATFHTQTAEALEH